MGKPERMLRLFLSSPFFLEKVRIGTFQVSAQDPWVNGRARSHVYAERWFCARRVARAEQDSPARSEAECWVAYKIDPESRLRDGTCFVSPAEAGSGSVKTSLPRTPPSAPSWANCSSVPLCGTLTFGLVN
jgi:hypothetical protein